MENKILEKKIILSEFFVFRIQAQYGIEDAEREQMSQNYMKMTAQQIRKVFDVPKYENLETLADEMLTQEELRIRMEERAGETELVGVDIGEKSGSEQELYQLEKLPDEDKREVSKDTNEVDVEHGGEDTVQGVHQDGNDAEQREEHRDPENLQDEFDVEQGKEDGLQEEFQDENEPEEEHGGEDELGARKR